MATGTVALQNDAAAKPKIAPARQRIPKLRSQARSAGAFTLVEVLLASLAAAMVLVIVYSIFATVIRLRDNSTARVRQTRLRARAAAILRRDLQGALISGGLLANVLEGDANQQSPLANSAAPGYLRLTTTTGKDGGSDLYGDVQEVEYRLVRSTEAGGSAASKPSQGGTLVRTITRNLLATTAIGSPLQETLLTNVESMQVAFYDGTAWQQSWQATPTSTTDGTQATATPTTAANLPQAIRVDIRQLAPAARDSVPPLLEILVPWTTQPFTTPTPTPASS